MAPKKKSLGPDFEIDEANDLCRCKICFAVDPCDAPWMKRKSAKDHLDTAKHKQNLAQKNESHRLERLERERYERTWIGQIPLTEPNQVQLEPPMQPRNMFIADRLLQSQEPETHAEVVPSDLLLYPEESLHESDIDSTLREQFEALLAQAVHIDEFGQDEDEPEDLLAEDDDLECDIGSETLFNDEMYRPYPSKVTMLLDILDNLPRLRLSSLSLKLIIWMLKELRVSDVPSFTKFRQFQEELQNECGFKPKAHVSDFSNHYHSIPLRDSIAKDFANPQVAPHINLYPERTDGPRSEIWQFDRWTEFSPSQLTPMFSRGLKQFWIEEVAQLSNGVYVIPHNWIYELSSDCSLVNVTSDGWVITNEQHTFPSFMFIYNHEDVVAQIGDSVRWRSDSQYAPQMPNPLRELAGGEDLYVVMIPLWCDDVSGNKSKQYNKHINIYSLNGSLPGQMLQQEYFVNFVSTSPNATPLEQFQSIRDELKETEVNPMRCFNAATGQMCRTIFRVPILPADNPAQAEEASQMGGNSSHPCRKCKVGGHHSETETPDGYHCFFCDNKSLQRSAQEIKSELWNQMCAAMTGVEANVTKMQTQSGTKDKITQTWIEKLLSKSRAYKAEDKLSGEEITTRLNDWLESEPGEKMNPLLDITGLDPSQDTPVEILHTVLLGIVKYVWYMSHSVMPEKDLELLAIRLQSTDTDGLTVPAIQAAYMVQYRNNLIGKHFKTLMQILPFHVHNFAKLGPVHFRLIRSVGMLGPLLWTPEIKDLDQYLSDLDILVGNVLDAFGDVAPSKILDKIKIHLLVHLREDIRRFGPPIRYSTEVFEAYNAVFRLCSIFSNHQAPSRDIALKFASMGRLKHILSGGFWEHKTAKGSEWVQASQAVTDMLKNVPVIQRHLGWVPKSQFQSGQITYKSHAHTARVPWEETKASTTGISMPPVGILWQKGNLPKVMGQTGDCCKLGSWVFAKTEDNKQVIGRIVEILLRENSRVAHGVVTLEQFQLGAHLHEDFHCPILRRQMPQTHITVRSDAIQFRFSAQHDCRLAKCQPTRRVDQIQERQITERTRILLNHADDDNFVINMYGLHNALILREALPRSLSKPIPLYENRRGRHDEIARVLTVKQAEKRALTQEKTRITKARNRAANNEGTAESSASGGKQAAKRRKGTGQNNEEEMQGREKRNKPS
ncbi:hypothetical protein GGU10DRAFT_397813 [Lentinula aff. detonsa]|uniref:Uncharacterized protein n=1 Tax=Lentinula aff. detonsa TaxID=2804958 RepID=A0AA38KKL2_9AGAR|nr:hypothetical protein GGU10DRAFT_397813 [Lentinula aff. detonsa]